MIFATETEGKLSLHGLDIEEINLFVEGLWRKAAIAHSNRCESLAKQSEKLATDIAAAVINPIPAELDTAETIE